jgi:hypothetical protein
MIYTFSDMSSIMYRTEILLLKIGLLVYHFHDNVMLVIKCRFVQSRGERKHIYLTEFVNRKAGRVNVTCHYLGI